MKAIYYEKHGEANVLQYGERPTPTPGKKELLVRVHATSVNPVDWKIRSGKLLPIAVFKEAIIPGRDVSGVVEAVGEEVQRFKPGDKVFGMLDALFSGSYAEYAVIGEEVAAPMPANLNFNEAAAVPLTALTALQALRDKGELEQGEKVLINGASSAVGLFAIQIAKTLGAGEVTGVCSSSHIDLVKETGADRVIDYEKQDFTEEKNCYDLIFDAVAKNTFAATKGSLRQNGRYVTTVPNPKDVLGYVTSVFSDKKPKAMLVDDKGNDLNQLREWLEAGKVKPIIDKVFPLAEAADAHRYSEKEQASGKIILEVIKS